MRKGENLLRLMQDSCDSCTADVETVVNECISADDFENCVMDLVEDYGDLMTDCYPCVCSVMESVFGVSCVEEFDANLGTECISEILCKCTRLFSRDTALELALLVSLSVC